MGRGEFRGETGLAGIAVTDRDELLDVIGRPGHLVGVWTLEARFAVLSRKASSNAVIGDLIFPRLDPVARLPGEDIADLAVRNRAGRREARPGSSGGSGSPPFSRACRDRSPCR